MERLNLLLVLNLGLLLAGCPGDDGTDEGGNTGTAGDTTAGTTNPMNTTEAVDSTTTDTPPGTSEDSTTGTPPGTSEDSTTAEPPGTSEDSTTGEPVLSFANDVYPIIEANCSCHVDGGPGGLEMPDADTAYGNLVDVPSANMANDQDRVEPGDTEASFLWHKLNGTLAGGEGDPMPDGGPQLPAPELATIEQWIQGGAQP